MKFINQYKQNMIKEAERKAKYYEFMAGLEQEWRQYNTANNYLRKARVQHNKIKSLIQGKYWLYKIKSLLKAL